MTSMEERFDGRFLKGYKHVKGMVDLDKLGIPLVPGDIKAFIQEELNLQKASIISSIIEELEGMKIKPEKMGNHLHGDADYTDFDMDYMHNSTLDSAISRIRGEGG